jgi:hypothetical protein
VSTHKPCVVYRADMQHRIVVGERALIYPLAHPSDEVMGDGMTMARTSMVLFANPDGSFETENTCYVPDIGPTTEGVIW